MAPLGRSTCLAERLEIVERWQAGETDREIAAAMGCSRWTVRKWRRRYQHEGRSGMASSIGRPKSGALGSFPAPLREAIEKMREAHPGWGPQTLLAELEMDPRFAKQRLPSRARIAAYLKEKGYVRRYERRSNLPQTNTTSPQKPHEEWEMDAQGAVEVPGLGKVSLINLGDVYSSLKIESLACVETTHPNTKDYQIILRWAFLKVGLPQRISLDHDSVFYDNTSRSPFPSLLHLWLLALGVEVRFIRKPPPMEHSRIERLHQTIFNQAVYGQDFTATGLSGLQKQLWQRLEFLNNHYPSRSLGGKPPLVAFPEARHSGRPYRLEWEAEMLDLQRVYNYLAQGRWFRKTTANGQFGLGGHRYNAGRSFANQTLEITFDPASQTFVCVAENAQQNIRIPAQGLTKEDLMGELSTSASYPSYQLALPFSSAAWRKNLLVSHLRGTNL